jgi:hypothetical protein
MIVLRSALFWLALLLFTPPYALLALASAPLPRMARYRVISGWSRLMLWCLRGLCGIRWQIEGREHLPATPSVILSKHQSAWETLAFQQIFPPQVHVLKRNCSGSLLRLGAGAHEPDPDRPRPRHVGPAPDRAARQAAPRAGFLGGGVSRGHARRSRPPAQVPDGRRLAGRARRCAGGAGGAQCGAVLAAQLLPEVSAGNGADRTGDRQRGARPATIMPWRKWIETQQQTLDS